MFSLGGKAFSRRLWQNLFISVQLAATLLLMVQAVSYIEDRVGLYLKTRHLYEGNGIILEQPRIFVNR